MKRWEITQEIYLSEKERFYLVLKTAYLNDVEKATDKEYAKSYYGKIYFEKNSMIPYYTQLLNQLVTTFYHFNRLDESTSIEQTFNMLDLIREESTTSLQQTIDMIESKENILIRNLPVFYQEMIQDELCSLDEIVFSESKIVKFTDENIFALLALYEATKELFVEFVLPRIFQELEKQKPIGQVQQKGKLTEPEIEETQEIEGEDEPEELPKGKFTKAQLDLIVYYLMIGYGKEVKRNLTLTSVCSLIHEIAEKPDIKMVNSEYYKKLRKHVYNPDPKQAKENLKMIRPVFVKRHIFEVVKLIDEDFAKLP